MNIRNTVSLPSAVPATNSGRKGWVRTVVTGARNWEGKEKEEPDLREKSRIVFWKGERIQFSSVKIWGSGVMPGIGGDSGKFKIIWAEAMRGRAREDFRAKLGMGSERSKACRYSAEGAESEEMHWRATRREPDSEKQREEWKQLVWLGITESRGLCTIRSLRLYKLPLLAQASIEGRWKLWKTRVSPSEVEMANRDFEIESRAIRTAQGCE